MRHYLHGDPHEDGSGLYFCHKCDIFAPPRHFDMCVLGKVIKRGVNYKQTHEWRYVYYAKKLKSHPGVVEDRNNLFCSGPLDERKLPRLDRAS